MAIDYQDEKYTRVDKIAEEIRLKSESLSPARKENLLTKLYYAVWRLRDDYKTDLEVIFNKAGYGLNMSESIHLEAMNDAYRSTLNIYGKVDEKTGEIIPFSRLFLYYYGLKHKTVIKQQNKEEYRLRYDKSVRLVEKLKTKYPRKIEIKIKSGAQKKDFLVYCQQLGAGKEEYEPLLDEIYNNTHISSYNYQENINMKYEQENEAKKGYEGIAENDMETSSTILQLFSIVERINKDEKVSKILKRYVKYFITMSMFEERIPIKEEYAEYLDMQLWNYAESSVQEKNHLVIAEYLHKEPDTARKNINLARKLLIKYSGG